MSKTDAKVTMVTSRPLWPHQIIMEDGVEWALVSDKPTATRIVTALNTQAELVAALRQCNLKAQEMFEGGTRALCEDILEITNTALAKVEQAEKEAP